jgi:DNA-binding response OmpR family regulator
MAPRQAILIIDDEVNICRILEAKLMKYGFQVDITHDAASALGCLLHRRYDFVLLDVHLPDVDGLSAFPRFKEAAPWTPFLIMTAYEDERVSKYSRDSGEMAVLYKPFELESLLSIIRAKIGGNRRASSPLILEQFSLIKAGQWVTLSQSEASEEMMQTALIISAENDRFNVQIAKGSLLQKDRPFHVHIQGQDGVYDFTSAIDSWDTDAGLLVLEKPDTIFRRQRRSSSRAPVPVPVRLLSLVRQGQDDFQSELETMGRDLSVGGMAVTSSAVADTGTVFDVQWSLQFSGMPEEVVQAQAEVIRAADISSIQELPLYRIALRFTQLSQDAKDRILSFVEENRRAK